MRKRTNFWALLARAILRNRTIILLGIIGITLLWSTQWKHMQFTFTEANLLPDGHPENIQYQKFVQKFGDEGNLITIAVNDSILFTPERLEAWKKLNQRINAFPEVGVVLSIDNLQELKKDDQAQKLYLETLQTPTNPTSENLIRFKDKLFQDLPFYENLLFNAETQTVRTIVYMDPDIVNTAVRKDFIFEEFIPLIERYEKQTGVNLRVSGMPYIRTLNAQNIVDEIGLFVLSATLLTALIFFLFFRSFRATFIALSVVLIGVMWALGTLGLFRYEITVLTALIPPLIIVIGVPNCIFLINKYQQEVDKHGNQAKSLVRVISKIGNATLLTNLTTASGFSTFILTNSKILKEFGIIASLNILFIFILSLLIIPIVYSLMPPPQSKHLKHLKNKNIKRLINWMENQVRYRRINVFLIALSGLVLGIVGIYKINISGSLIEDMPKKSEFFQDIKFYDQEFDGIVPVEVLVNAQRKNGILKPSTLKRMNRMQDRIDEIPELSSPLSVVNAVKYVKQAYYNGNPRYFKLPTAQENSFIYPYINNQGSQGNLLTNYVDSTGQYARITTFMKDISTPRMEAIEAKLREEAARIFPEDRYQVTFTGKSLLFLKGTKYLIKNLLISLLLAILIIALIMAYMFRSFKMILISLVPNLLPLVITAGVMGYSGIPLKPSTILVFSIAFGISVDDTIHFLAKYRQELIASGWKIKTSIYKALRETGVSMFYTSIVLFFGFIVFMSSNFGGTVALGGLVSVTLLMAMLANLILLPALLISLAENISNEKVFKSPDKWRFRVNKRV